MKVISVNPATEKVNKEFETFPKEGIIKICKDSQKAFEEWKKLDIKERARIEWEGKRIDRAGYFYEPTILSKIKKIMKVLKEEVFGPVFSIVVVKNEEEAIKTANNSRFGLCASVWTKNSEKGEKITRKIDTGTVYVNNIVISNPFMPFGGIKQSGVGRELGTYGIKEFTNIKSVVVY